MDPLLHVYDIISVTMKTLIKQHKNVKFTINTQESSSSYTKWNGKSSQVKNCVCYTYNNEYVH